MCFSKAHEKMMTHLCVPLQGENPDTALFYETLEAGIQHISSRRRSLRLHRTQL